MRIVQPEIMAEWSILWPVRGQSEATERFLESARRCSEERGWLDTPEAHSRDEGLREQQRRLHVDRLYLAPRGIAPPIAPDPPVTTATRRSGLTGADISRRLPRSGHFRSLGGTDAPDVRHSAGASPRLLAPASDSRALSSALTRPTGRGDCAP